MRKTGSNLYMYDFSVDYNIIVVRHRIMFKFIKQAFISLLSFSGSLDCLAKLSDQTKCISLNNEPCTGTPTLIELNLEEHNQGLHHYLFRGSVDRYPEVSILVIIH